MTTIILIIMEYDRYKDDLILFGKLSRADALMLENIAMHINSDFLFDRDSNDITKMYYSIHKNIYRLVKKKDLNIIRMCLGLNLSKDNYKINFNATDIIFSLTPEEKNIIPLTVLRIEDITKRYELVSSETIEIIKKLVFYPYKKDENEEDENEE